MAAEIQKIVRTDISCSCCGRK